MIWLKSIDPCQDCYFCLTKTKGLSFKQRDKITHPYLDSVRNPVPHEDLMPPPASPQHGFDAIGSSADEYNSKGLISFNYTDSDITEDHILFSQNHLNDLIRGLCFSTDKTELFALR